MDSAGILLHMHTKCSNLQADPTQIGRNHLTSRDCLRGGPPYIGVILSVSKENCGNSKGRVESESAGQTVFINVC